MQTNVIFSGTGGWFSTEFYSLNDTFQAAFDGASSLRVYEDYGGSYDITPMITAQRLETADKHMLDDVFIRTIPTQEIEQTEGSIVNNDRESCLFYE